MPSQTKRLMRNIHKRNTLAKWLRKHQFEAKVERNLISYTIDAPSTIFHYMKQHIVTLLLGTTRAEREAAHICTHWLKAMDDGHIYHPGDWWRRFAVPQENLVTMLKCYELWSALRIMRVRRQRDTDPSKDGLTTKDRLTMRRYMRNLQQDVGESAEMR